MVAWGTNITFGIFFKPLLIEFGWTRAMISGASSLHTVVRGLFYFIVGKLNDKFGPKILLVICGLLLGSSYLLMSELTAIWQLYMFYGVMVGIGMSASFTPVATTVAAWFMKGRGIATSIFLSGASLGCMVMAPISNWLISSYGWRTSYNIIGIVALVAIVLVAQLIKRDPRESGQLAYGVNKVREDSLNWETEGPSFQQAIRTKQFWILCVIMFCGSFCQFTVLIHLVSYGIDLGISASASASLLAIATGLGIVGRVAIGIASDRIGNKRVLLICFSLFLIDFMWLLIAKEFWMLCVFAVVIGLVGSVSVVLPSPMVAELFGLNSHSPILGAVMFGSTIGGAAGPLLAGYIYDLTTTYNLGIMICVIFSGAGIILTLALIPAMGKVGNAFH